MFINCDSLIRFSFLASLFLYPFNFFSHTLYIIPQLVMLGAMFLKSIMLRNNLCLPNNSVILATLAALSIGLPFFSEAIRDNSTYLFPIKLTLNTLSILAIFFSRVELIHSKDFYIIKKFAIIYLILSLYLYFFSTNSLSIVVTIQNFLINSKSSLLYTLAAPLDQFFLSKNIAAMYMASLFAYYLFLGNFYRLKIEGRSFLLFGLLILTFFSRQGIVAYIALSSLYIYLKSNLKKKITYSIIFGSILSLFFLTFFNFESKGDGSNERIHLYHHFFTNLDHFFWYGLGEQALPPLIQSGGINTDNYHFFLMNQIALYGIFHTFLFNTFLIWIFLETPQYYRKSSSILVACYFLNVSFQTFGFEFQNLWLFMILASLKEESNVCWNHHA